MEMVCVVGCMKYAFTSMLKALFDNTAAAMNGVPDFIKERHAKHCYQCDPAYGEGIAKALGMDIDFSDVK